MTALPLILGATAAAAASLAVTAAVRSYAIRTRLLDVPNARSSHSTPIPRGGGVAIAAVTLAAIVFAGASGLVESSVAYGLAIPGVLLAATGFVDDRRGLPAGLRLLVQVVAVTLGLWLLGDLPPLAFGGVTLRDDAALFALYAVALLWAINLFNFMDGIDGLAGVETVCVAGGLALLLVMEGAVGSAFGPAVLAGSAAGFLVMNWQPARIFMGDVGSGFVGFAIAYLAIAASNDAIWAFPATMCLAAIFIADATVTLLVRLFRGERVSQAHRSHAYQRLSRHWASHARVSRVVAVVNGMVLLPTAAFSVANPEVAWAAAGTAVVLGGLVAHALGAGRPGDIRP